MPTDWTQSKTLNVGSTAAGAGGGTLMVLIANSLSEHSFWKPWIMFAAPTVTVGLRAFCCWTAVQIVDYGKDWLLQRRLGKARMTVQRGLQTVETSPEHKATLRKNLEEIEKIEVDNAIDRVRILVQNRETPPAKPVTNP